MPDQKIRMIKNERNVLNTAKNLCEGRELIISAFKSGLFLLIIFVKINSRNRT